MKSIAAEDLTPEMIDRLLRCSEAATDGLWDWDLKTDQVWYNEKFYRDLGYTADQWQSTLQAFNEKLHPDDLSGVWSAVQDHLQQGTDYDIDFRLRTASGEYRWFRSRGKVVLDDSGQAIRMTGAIQSIERQKRAEFAQQELAKQLDKEIAERRTAEALYYDLYNLSPDMYVSVDASTGLILRCNQTLAKRLGIESEELIGIPIESIYHPSSRAEMRQTFQNFLRDGEVRNVELALQDSHGNPIPVVLNATAIRDEQGRIVASRSVWRDVSELVRARNQLQELNLGLEQRVEERTKELARQNKELDQFVHIASHDLKAPLHGIRLAASWLAEDCGHLLPETSKELLQTLETRVERLEQMLKSILAYSMAGREQTPLEWVDVAQLIENVIPTIAQGKAINFDIPTDLPNLKTHRQSLTRVIQNLLSNAVRHATGNHLKIKLTCGIISEDVVEFRVEDNGPGIEPRFRDRVFEMFQTLRPRDEVEGSGLGLSIVKRLVEAQSGSIEILDSSLGGAEFRFTWKATLKKNA